MNIVISDVAEAVYQPYNGGGDIERTVETSAGATWAFIDNLSAMAFSLIAIVFRINTNGMKISTTLRPPTLPKVRCQIRQLTRR